MHKRLIATIIYWACVTLAPVAEAGTSYDGALDVKIDSSPTAVAEQTPTMDDQSRPPLFGMETEPVFGGLALTWRAVELEIGREEKVIADCRAQKPCPEPARKLLDIVAEGRGSLGRARVGLINRAVDLAITATADELWSPPFETLHSGRGDCED